MALRFCFAVGLALLLCAQPAFAAPKPELGRTALVNTVSGKVFAKERGEDRFKRLSKSPTLVRLEAELDATDGKVRVRTAAGKRKPLMDGEFSKGSFSIFQGRAGGIVNELLLTGGDAGACAAGGAAVERRLSGETGDRFRTRGRSGVVEALKRGTKWVMEDRCNGTRTVVKRGQVDAAADNGALSLDILEGQTVHHFCDFDGMDAVSREFCTMLTFSPDLGIWGGAVMNIGDATSYDLCLTGPTADERCETYALSEPYDADGRRDSIVTCPAGGPGAYALRWLIDGVQVGPQLGFEINAPPGQGCLHRP